LIPLNNSINKSAYDVIVRPKHRKGAFGRVFHDACQVDGAAEIYEYIGPSNDGRLGLYG
jgi:hypothetical protein